MTVGGPITAEQIASARAALDRPAHLAEGLPGAFYGEAAFELERRKLFTRTWCAVSVASALPEVGDVLPINLAGWPIVLTRNRDGEIRAFHNICRHRAMQLVREPCQRAKLLRCPWHSWSYDLDGKLLATPDVGGGGVHQAPGFDPAELALKPISVGQYLDYVFVNLDENAEPFDQHIAPVVNLLASLDLSDLRHGDRIDDVYNGNWKISTEGGIEDYHLTFAHPQLDAHLARNTSSCAADGVFAGGWVQLGAMYEQIASPEQPLLPFIQKDQAPFNGMLIFNIFPTATVLVTPDHVMVGILLPMGAAKTRVELHFYYRGDTAVSVEHGPARAQVQAMWKGVIPQDYPFIEGCQATVESRDIAGVRIRFSPTGSSRSYSSRRWCSTPLVKVKQQFSAVEAGLSSV